MGRPDLGGLLGRPGRRQRRHWVGDGRAYIEVRAVHRGHAHARQLIRHVEEACGKAGGVKWAKVIPVLGRVVVALDDHIADFDAANLDDLISIIEAAEEAFGVDGEPFPLDRPEHPGDIEPLRRGMYAIGADMAGLGLATLGRIVRSTPIPYELAGLVSIIDAEPRLRHFLEARLGGPVTDIGLAVTNAAAQGLAQGPLGLVLDLAYRVTVLGEVQARRTCWEARHGELCRPPVGGGGTDPIVPEPVARPLPRPPGPVERYADRAAIAATAGAGATLVATRNGRRASATLLAGVPKAARLGREGFAAQLSRTLASRGVLVLDRAALRRLDAIDCLCIDERFLITGRLVLEQLRVVGGAERGEVEARLRSLYDPERPQTLHRRQRWTAGPLDQLAISDRRGLSTLGDPGGLGHGHRGRPIGLARNDRLVALARAVPEIDPLAHALVRLARREGHMVAVAGSDQSVVHGLDADLSVDGGTGLADSVRMLQSDGCSVLLVAGPEPAALMAADCSMEASIPGTPVTMAGHLLAAQTLEDACFLVEASGAARHASRQATAVALIGSGLATINALTGPANAAPSRAMTAVNVAGMVSLANGTRAAIGLARRPRTDRHHAPPPWHELEVSAVLDLLETSPSGLDEAQVRRRAELRAEPDDRPPALWSSVLEELANPFTPILAAGAAASAAVGGAADAGLVAAVTAVNGLVGGVQRYHAQRALASLARTSALPVRVIRSGQPTVIEAGAVVPGDILVVAAGDGIPADCRILEADHLEVDESSVTGESVPVAKSAQPCFAAPVAERSCVLYEGTSVAAGRATAVVVATGVDTEAGRSLELTGDRTPPAGVERRLGRLSALTLPIVLAGGAAVTVTGLLRGRSPQASLASGVSLAVAAVPEGLPILATMAQLAAARRLSTRGALVRDPRAIEALGRVDVLCTDKTGTLTEGRISLQRLSDGRRDVATTGPLRRHHRHLVGAGLRASPPPDDGEVLPHLTDRAVVEGAAAAGVGETEGRPGWRRGAELPFEPARGFHATTGGADDGSWLSVKGAPETLLPRCTSWADPDGTREIDAAVTARLDVEVDRLARMGFRILAVAERPMAAPAPDGDAAPDPDPGCLADEDVNGLCLLGFLVLSDPVRCSAAAAVAKLRLAGVNVVMVTGDHPSTAEGIAVELGILDGKRVITGCELARLDDAALDAVLPEVSVVARVTPADKVRIVAAFQRTGHSVAMTGDGANDAPAIRMADVGIALGATSTPAARGAADLVVTDERVETVVDAIVEGRAMWASVREALAILLGGNLGEVGFTLGTTLVAGQAALSPRQLLLVNLLTDVAPALAIALRPPRDRSSDALLREGPDTSLGSALERAILLRAVATGGGAGAAWLLARATGTRRRASSTALVALVGCQLGQTLATG
ncbi:MAG: cation-translocating P-type ATPase, partial [Actinomycetota bacterium]|nr:cation-translocating P-type ATPase [Actinomycetota bacterium]